MNEFYFTCLNYPPKIRRMLYATNSIEKLDKEFRRTFKIRNAMPSAELALTLL
jgi:transposase-like protein